MQTREFDDYLKTRLTKEEIEEIEKEAEVEYLKYINFIENNFEEKKNEQIV